MKRSKRVILCLVSVFILIGLTVTMARSQTTPNNTPGMSIIAEIAKDVALLKNLLQGNIPATIPQTDVLPDATGLVGTYQSGGATNTSENAFFSSAITKNGRTCFTCHQPQNGWAINPPQIFVEFLTTGGKSVLFQPIDAADRPNSPGATAPFFDPRFIKARSQLFTRGNFRISLNAPNPLGPQGASYTTFGGNTNPEWVLTAAYDPFGSELDPVYGLPANLLSVYRRPLPAANKAFVLQFNSSPNPRKFDIMWDAREPNLENQFINATLFHGQTNVAPDSLFITQGVLFQSGLFSAQTYNVKARDLTGGDGSGALGGPTYLYNWRDSTPPPPTTPPATAPACTFDANLGLICPKFGIKQVVNGLRFNVASQLYAAFASPTTGSASQKAQRESIARGEVLFSSHTFTINNVAGLNDVKNDVNGTEIGTCSTCHSYMNVLNDAPTDPKHLGIMDNSSTAIPFTSDFPRFAIYCPTGSIPFFSNPVSSTHCPGGAATCDEFITTDPGMGLVTGLCEDLGKMKVPILRGVAARAPYFHGGNAMTLTDVINFYDTRFNIGLTTQQKEDLINYLNSL